jgi:hypothetical protein
MADDILVCSYCDQSRRHAMLVDDGCTGWLYLHGPSADPNRTASVEGTAFAYNRGLPIDRDEVKNYRPKPPPITKDVASNEAVCAEPGKYRWEIFWSDDGRSARLTRDEELWCVVDTKHPRGFSKAVRVEGGWGSPFDCVPN